MVGSLLSLTDHPAKSPRETNTLPWNIYYVHMFDLSLQELEYVAALADERNFTRTARRVHMAQPALSQAIKRIERRLGVRLFDRTSRRVIPTVAGEVLAAEAVRIHGSVHQAVRRTRQAAGQPEHMRVHVSEPSLTTPRQILAAIRAH